MIVLIILGIIIAILLLLLFLPVTVDFAYEKQFVLKVRYAGITLFDNTKKSKAKKQKCRKSNSNQHKVGKAPKKKESFIKTTYKQKGLLGTINYFSSILSLVLKKLWWVVKRIEFRRFRLNLIVATSDAADTAIQYGRICAAVYPVLSLLQTSADFKPKEINISADFEKTKSEFEISVFLKIRLFYGLAAVISAMNQFLKLQRKEREKYERKQS